ncbi:MAG: Fe-S cluster assembly ATPase SufC [Paludibacteraceae bacterium]|nr:Fe-S cluster assembly ATPase SufC [Paludibacteraceae bacterium]MBQ7671635.1 Fe-S cluster assembly ATPase SufC [Paludibacteraceae bacterium]MBR4546800.1 Fe-S cluster assembly ATPase SufC [Paludibacteraceae bacterium]MBR6145570.1 Fe-S cluster assembly ATPase SufC [Paludibacteraceae bacterium]
MLEITNLHASVGGKEILKGLNLRIGEGEIHALMGRNGAGKSTLSAVLTGNPAYTVTEGSITFNGKDMLSLTPDQRANEGLFLSFQYPVEIPGVSMVNFLKAAVNAKRQYQGLEPLSATEFLRLKREKEKLLEITAGMQNRSVNEGFSGGEKKKNEVFQMAMLQPSLAILDETDSGLDVDALRIVADGFNKIRTPQMSAIIITHYERMLDYIRPDFVHVLYGGTIVETGDATLAKQIDERGFDWIEDKYKA